MRFVVILGSNSGERRQLLERATSIVASRTGRLLMTSGFYETEPWGFESEELFLNQVAVFESEFAPEVFLSFCLQTEQELGRVRTPQVRYSSRTIDIDILFCDDAVVNTPTLTVPHPRLQERNFVLTPLNEVLPDFIHPILHKKVSELLEACPDTLVAKRVSVPESVDSLSLS